MQSQAMAEPGYETLAAVLLDAYQQAAIGKGAQRHADGKPFDQQPMQQLIELYGIGFALGQAGKKSQEAMRLEYPAARRELLGGIVYLAGAILALDAKHGTPAAANDNAAVHRECATCKHADASGFMCMKPGTRCAINGGSSQLVDWEARKNG